MRDLLTVLGIDKVTVVGHSFGGGVAMQFAYQFPERTERMILVAPGGLGPEVTPAIRAITLARLPPGDGRADAARASGTSAWPGCAALAGRPAHGHPRPRRGRRDLRHRSGTRSARRAIRHVVRAVVDWRGQIVTMVDRAYLTEAMPMCVIWGARRPR